MLRLSRRAALLGAAGALLAARRPPEAAPMGAIRWDAWQAPGSATTRAVERSLSPPEYHHRLPFFAAVDPDGSAQIDGGSQAVMDREIALARDAGLGFFAFLAYPRGSAMGRGLEMFLASTSRGGLRFCLICELRNWGSAAEPAALVAEHAALLRHPDQLRLADGRPVYCLGFISPQLVEERWGGPAGLAAAVDRFRHEVRRSGAGDPFLVVMVRPDLAALARQIGADALSAYSIADGSARGEPYSALSALAEARWASLAATGLKVAPTAMAGWDRRPRVANPVPWERAQRRGAGMDRYYREGTAAEIATHVARARGWATQHPASAGFGLIYAWNENDEGGWLVPTLPFDDSRLRALREALSR